ncbi:MAG: hypothetical protein E6501_17585 [Bradyrhizobium sp.]|nr:hypothetical protein [Bradyrhizobium sp.]
MLPRIPLLLDHGPLRDINLSLRYPCSLNGSFLLIDYATCLTDIKNKTPGEIAGR